LKWNEFEANIGVAFRELREDKDFFDVTLACDEEQIQAHKVILSACSPFFRKVLKRNRHDHPLLYLKGVKYQDLVSLLNFMYHGQVHIAQEELDAFLTIAEELQIKGLTQSHTSQGQEAVKEVKQERGTKPARSPPIETPPVARSVPRPAPTYGTPPQPKKPRYRDDDIQEITPVKVEQIVQTNTVSEYPVTSEEGQVQNYEMDQVAANDTYDESLNYEDYNIDQDEPGEGATFDATLISTSLSEGEFDLKTVLEKFTKKIINRDGTSLWQCKSCQKIYKRKSHLIEHVESCHVTGLQFKCPYCSVFYKTRSSVRHHVNDKHKEEHTVYKMDMANLEWALVQ